MSDLNALLAENTCRKRSGKYCSGADTPATADALPQPAMPFEMAMLHAGDVLEDGNWETAHFHLIFFARE